jgi:glycogen phosphorylase
MSPKIGTKKRNAVDTLKKDILRHISSTLGHDPTSTNRYCYFKACTHALRDRLVDRWIKTQRAYYEKKAKRIYYLSMEFLPGRFLRKNLESMNMMEVCRQTLQELGISLEEIEELEWDAGLGNGGLGRLASCFLDSLATLEIPAYGYGIRYDYGIFYQVFENGYQVEKCDNWMRYGNSWEFERPEHLYEIRFNGHVRDEWDEQGRYSPVWEGTESIMAMACDTLIPGYGTDHVINMRLWAAKSSREFNLDLFKVGQYIKAVEDKTRSENISKVLYPSEETLEGKELRLRQQYFFVSATFQDIVRRFKKRNLDFSVLPSVIAVQLNDTHPVIAIPELMRILVDEEKQSWGKAWDICIGVFGYTNHTILPEALETWPVSMMKKVLPRHVQIIYEINRRFLDEVREAFPGDTDRLSRMSMIQEGNEKHVRMAHLGIVGSHSINGVSRLHSRLLKEYIFKDFNELYPTRFNNKTNGITPRQWLLSANPGLSGLIRTAIGGKWATDLSLLRQIEPFADDPGFRAQWQRIRSKNKERLADYFLRKVGIRVDTRSLFDVQAKRIHEYKRQILNLLYVITLYCRIKEKAAQVPTPRTVIFGGKAAPGYHMAKMIIKLINSVSETINADPEAADVLKVIFVPNYCVSQAEKLVAATDLSQQISTAGMEASGTGNMKFALNGAIIIGTLDGANVEIMEEVGRDNIFIFGLTVDEVKEKLARGYMPHAFYDADPELRAAIDMINSGRFNPSEPHLFDPVINALFSFNEPYMVFADYRSYVDCQDRVAAAWLDPETWTRRSILSTARMGYFSSDRTIAEYAKDIWKVTPISKIRTR